MRLRVCLLGVALAAAVPAGAQTVTPGPPGPYVIDLRGATIGLPDSAAFFPDVGDAVEIPSRGFGVDVGAHVYLFSLGPARLGFGGDVLAGRGRVTSVASDATAAARRVEVDLWMVVPQLSFNFGTSDGWSYLSAGIGVAAVRTRVDSNDRRTGGVSAINAGGGARWFISTHVAVGFDVRFHKLSSGTATPRTTLMSASVGLSVK